MGSPEHGEHWIDRRPMTDNPAWRDTSKYRRCVEVTEVDSAHVYGLSYWQAKTHGRWFTRDYPAPRKTRILRHVFERRFLRKESSNG